MHRGDLGILLLFLLVSSEEDVEDILDLSSDLRIFIFVLEPFMGD